MNKDRGKQMQSYLRVCLTYALLWQLKAQSRETENFQGNVSNDRRALMTGSAAAQMLFVLGFVCAQ